MARTATFRHAPADMRAAAAKPRNGGSSPPARAVVRVPRGGTLIAALAGATALLQPSLAPPSVAPLAYALAVPASVVAAWAAGWRAGAAVTVLCAASMPLLYGWPLGGGLVLSIAGYLAVGGLGVLLGQRLRDTRARRATVGQRERDADAAARASAQMLAMREAHERSADGFELLRPVVEDGRTVDFEWDYINHAAAEWLGADAARLVGTRVSAAPPRALQAARVEHWLAVLARGEPGRASFRRDADGDEGAASLRESSAVPLRDGRIAVTTRPAAPAPAAPDAMPERLVAGLGHELRSPLHAIVGWAELIGRAGSDGALLQRGVDAIIRNARAQAELVDDLLDASCVAGGPLALARRRCDVVELLRGAVAASRPAAQTRWVVLGDEGVGAGEGALAVDADADRLQRVFRQLLADAIRGTPVGGVVRVTLERHDRIARIEIRDSGDGFAAERLPAVLWPPEAPGSGAARARPRGSRPALGLAIVRALVESHGGRLRLASDGPGRGTVAQIELPLASARRTVWLDSGPAPALLPPTRSGNG